MRISDWSSDVCSSDLWLPAEHPVATFLLEELERAIVVDPDFLPDQVVAMNAQAIFRLDGLPQAESRMLVYPDRYHPTGQYLSILSPVGVALLGLREGRSMPFRTRDGAASRIHVEKVLAPPAF